MAAANSAGFGRADPPVDAVADELEGPAAVGRGDDGLARQERLERHVAEVLVVGRVAHRERIAVQPQHLVVGDGAEQLTRSETPSPSASRCMFARCVPSPATTRRTGGATKAIARIGKSTRLTLSMRPTDST